MTDAAQIAEAVAALKGGGLVILPTHRLLTNLKDSKIQEELGAALKRDFDVERTLTVWRDHGASYAELTPSRIVRPPTMANGEPVELLGRTIVTARHSAPLADCR